MYLAERLQQNKMLTFGDVVLLQMAGRWKVQTLLWAGVILSPALLLQQVHNSELTFTRSGVYPAPTWDIIRQLHQMLHMLIPFTEPHLHCQFQYRVLLI